MHVTSRATCSAKVSFGICHETYSVATFRCMINLGSISDAHASMMTEHDASMIPYSLKFSRIKYFAVLPNSAQNQIFADKIFVV